MVSKPNMAGQWASSARFAVALVVIDLLILAACTWRDLRRNLVPLDVPISLSQRDFHTPEFEVTNTGLYYVELVLNRGSEDAWCALGVADCSGNPSVSTADWSLRRKGRLIDHGSGTTDRGAWRADSPGWMLGHFQAEEGRYALDVHFRQDASRLNSYGPRLVVGAWSLDYGFADEIASCAVPFALLSLPIAGCVLIRAMIVRREEEADAFARTWSLTETGPQHAFEGWLPIATGHANHLNMPRRDRHRSSTSRYAVVLNLTLSPLLAAFLVAKGLEHDAYMPHGLPLHLIKHEAAPLPSGIAPLRVHVAHDGRTAIVLYLDSQPVSSGDFDALLKKRLAERPPDWPVYVEGDPDLEWRSVAQAIDRIRGAGGHAVLIRRGQ